MKVGTDSMILGAWAPLPSSGTLLDLGAGTGVLSLMAAQRFPELKIHALEIDQVAARQCSENLRHSRWSDSFTIIPSAIQAWHGGPYDAIISNPPYFAGQHQALGFERNQARAGNQLGPKSFVFHLNRLLSEDGLACIVIPTDKRWLDAIQSLFVIHSGLAVSDIQTKSPKRLYLALRKSGHHSDPQAVVLKEGVNGPYSPWYKSLTTEFHLPGALR